ncbi:hypothetical protein I316_04365 [Kwoniella heveanensis BCC8398]|uniref:mRNA-capping enzyme subunit beta n=1 Tax=Kwoniella heveanensis BCC8398 TaxID=1296120 RepID=A0A1B9GSG7_9TREE|nr:hypothetical protein I316_04365 [Kwoniella heveanensis BCC8398]
MSDSKNGSENYYGDSTPPPVGAGDGNGGSSISANGGGSYVPRQRENYHDEEVGTEAAEAAAGPSRKRARHEENEHHQQDEYGNNNQQYYRPPYQEEEHQQQYGGHSRHQPHLTGSIFNISPRNPFTAVVGDFIMAHASGLDNVEIEIKLGTLMTQSDPSGMQQPRRVRMPTQSETIVPPDYPLGPFQSTMHPHQYRVLNNLLNSAVQGSQQLPRSEGRVQFSRSKLNDSFYGYGGRGGGKVRVSRDRDTGRVVEGGVIKKRRVADLNVYCPNMPFDWRISVNVEEPHDMPTGAPTMTRDKDRACYRHQVCQVDLTHVMSKPLDDPNARSTSSFEIEIEILDVPTLIHEGQAGSDRFDEILQNVLDTARMLIKNSEPAPGGY